MVFVSESSERDVLRARFYIFILFVSFLLIYNVNICKSFVVPYRIDEAERWREKESKELKKAIPLKKSMRVASFS